MTTTRDIVVVSRNQMLEVMVCALDVSNDKTFSPFRGVSQKSSIIFDRSNTFYSDEKNPSFTINKL